MSILRRASWLLALALFATAAEAHVPAFDQLQLDVHEALQALEEPSTKATADEPPPFPLFAPPPWPTAELQLSTPFPWLDLSVFDRLQGLLDSANRIRGPDFSLGLQPQEIQRFSWGIVVGSSEARFYDPEIGRFTSVDPFEGTVDEPPSLHRYLYAYANPPFTSTQAVRSLSSRIGSRVSKDSPPKDERGSMKTPHSLSWQASRWPPGSSRDPPLYWTSSTRSPTSSRPPCPRRRVGERPRRSWRSLVNSSKTPSPAVWIRWSKIPAGWRSESRAPRVRSSSKKPGSSSWRPEETETRSGSSRARQGGWLLNCSSVVLPRWSDARVVSYWTLSTVGSFRVLLNS